MAIRIFITGGTFDKEYNELNGELYFKETHMDELLKMGRSRAPVKIKTLMMIDGHTIYFLSPQAPLAKELQHKKPGDQFVFGGKRMEILEIS